ncbi:hypothetical protein ACFRAQ_23215 [Nocardia sp. NPDC056611]|uniref:hypothetical protein n=1 Tax=Nocardia sp. NPDC056611 TaxID=3345877 RepID=UPI00366C31CB
MSDDAAQDKKTEDDSIAEADSQGNAEKVTETTAGTDAAEPTASTDAELTVSKDAEPTVSKDAEPKASVDAAAGAEPETGEPAAESKAAKSGLLSAVPVPLVALGALGVVAVAAIAGAAGFWWQSHDRAQQLDARDNATSAACGFVRTLTAYDEKSLPDFAARMKSQIADGGEFAQSFEPVAADLQDLLIKQHAKATLGMLRCAYESGDANKATILVDVLQTASNDLHAQPVVLPLPSYVELEKKGDKWLVTKYRTVYGNDDSAIPGAGGDKQGIQPSGQATPPAQPAPTSAAPKPGN